MWKWQSIISDSLREWHVLLGSRFWSVCLYDTMHGVFLYDLSSNRGTVFMGDNNICKIVGIGSVRITLISGISRTIEDVRHVLALWKILISLGNLLQMATYFLKKKGLLKIMNVAFIIKKGDREASLSWLRGHGR